MILNESCDWKKENMVFTHQYYEDFPNFNGLEAELDFRYKIQDCVKFKNNLPDSISVTLKGVHSLAIPNINLALKLLSTLPITTFEYEKLFSSFPIVKTWDCSTVANARLNGSTL